MEPAFVAAIIAAVVSLAAAVLSFWGGWQARKMARVAQHTERFGRAAEQIGSQEPSVRLAGVYAMAALADAWKEQRQQCVDVLCAYLRLPPRKPDGEVQEGEQQVRLTVVSVVREHLLEEAKTSWSDLDFDLQGAEFLGDVVLNGARFLGNAWFDQATFGGDAKFEGATFLCDAWFAGATFSGRAAFTRATFARDACFGGGARIRDLASTSAYHAADLNVEGATFNGDTEFVLARFAQTAGFSMASFAGTAEFQGVSFNGDTRFEGATFNEGAVFRGATLSRDVDLTEAASGPERVVLPVGSVVAGPVVIPATQSSAGSGSPEDAAEGS